jgi:small subunit ribosomal protein S4
MHPNLRRKVSDYKKRHLEKQKLRFSYWISEKQFRNYVQEAFKRRGVSGATLLSLLERRLDNIVYRLGLAPTLPAARQLVVHGHILVNGRRVDRPSYSVREGDVVSVREESREIALVEEGMARSPAHPKLPYLEVDRENLKGTLTSIPERNQIPLEVNEALVVEHYSKYL